MSNDPNCQFKVFLIPQLMCCRGSFAFSSSIKMDGETFKRKETVLVHVQWRDNYYFEIATVAKTSFTHSPSVTHLIHLDCITVWLFDWKLVIPSTEHIKFQLYLHVSLLGSLCFKILFFIVIFVIWFRHAKNAVNTTEIERSERLKFSSFQH